MSSKKVVLTSSDGESFEIEEVVARKLQIIGNMIDDDCADKAIPLANVTGKILALVVEYCKKHVDDQDSTKEKVDEEAKVEELKTWDIEVMKNLDIQTTFSVILAANYLNVKDLLDLSCQNIADNIKDKSPEEVREIFGITNDYTPEEEEKVRQENAWAFETDPRESKP